MGRCSIDAGTVRITAAVVATNMVRTARRLTMFGECLVENVARAKLVHSVVKLTLRDTVRHQADVRLSLNPLDPTVRMVARSG